MTQWRVEVTGLRQVIDALEQVDKKAANSIFREIRAGAQQIATAASYLVPGRNPVSNWGSWIYSRDGRDLSFDPGAAASGFKVRRNNFKRRGVAAGLGYDILQTNAGGNIFEVMGDGSRVTTSSGQNLVDTVASRYPGKTPRTLIKAYYSVDVPAMQERIRNDIIDAARKAGLD